LFFYVLRFSADDTNGEDDDRADDASRFWAKIKKTNTTTDNLNVMRYLNLRFTDLVTYEDNEKDAGSENVNIYNGKDDRRF